MAQEEEAFWVGEWKVKTEQSAEVVHANICVIGS